MERFAQVKEDFDSLCRVVTDTLRKDGLYAQIGSPHIQKQKRKQQQQRKILSTNRST